VTPRVSVAQVVRVFTLTGILSIGGGRAAFFYEALVTRRRWMRVDEFLADFTLAQLLPGATFSNLSITLGHRLAGVAGALGGLAAVVVPGGVILLALAALYVARGLTPDVTTLMRGMSAAVVGLVAVTTLRLARPALVSARAFVIAAATFAAVGPLKLNTPVVIVVMTAVGLWLNRPEPARYRRGEPQ
jgi:chromate transporter